MNTPLIAAIAALVWAGGIGVGVTMSSKVDGALRSQVQKELAQAVASAPAASPAKLQAIAKRVQAKQDDRSFRKSLVADAKAFGVRAPSVKKLRAAQRYKRLLRKPQRLKVGKRVRKGVVELKALSEAVRYKRQGAFVKSRHTVLSITNRGKTPIAYNLEATAANRGRCEVKGTRPHNAIALGPKETAKVTICAGTSPVQVTKLEILEISSLGYHYLSQVPPKAFGLEASRASAHVIPGRRSSCAKVPQGAIFKALREGTTRWDDVADFYSRHDCRRFQMPVGYRRARRKISRFPVSAAQR